MAAVEQLAEGKAARGDAQIGGFIDDAGAFAAQFQRHGSEVFAGGAHDLAADRHAAGEEDVIKPLMQQRLIFRAAAFDQRDVFGREALGDNLRDDL